MFDYRNPFVEYNSNILSSEQISEFFTEPFDLFDITATDISREKSSIIFIGGRGTGKTMLLRQFSYNVQKVSMAERMSYLDRVKQDKYIGVYFRVDTPLLRSLESIGRYSESANFAEDVFIHFFELSIFKEYLEIVKIFLSDCKIEKGTKSYYSVIQELKALVDCSFIPTSNDVDDFLAFIIGQINYVWKYQSEKAIDIDGNIKFVPACGMVLPGRLSNEFLKTSIFHTIGLDEVNVLLLIDEFENFSETQQKVINTAMRFSKDYGARFRIGMRPNGFKTFGTLDNTDFVKEGRDYRKVECGFAFVRKGHEPYPELVKRIADKRLNASSQLKGRCIVDILGESENLEAEAKEIVRGRSKHFDKYIQLINKKNGTNYVTDDLLMLKHENPLFEMENLRLLLSGKPLNYVLKAFHDYLKNIDSVEKQKYYNDYNKKYKLTFVHVLCSIYRVEKKWYYSFSDYCQLSSGVVGHFIELCRTAFDIAYFRERDALFNGHISAKIQTDAAYEVAYSERDMIPRIKTYGNALATFISNIGNAFGHIHMDLYMRYPETNSFPVVIDTLEEENRKLLEVACMWSLLIKKPNLQDTNAQGKKMDIFYLNRILAPVYKISYRIRGGFNPVKISDSYFKSSFEPHGVLPPEKTKDKAQTSEESDQLTLFS